MLATTEWTPRWFNKPKFHLILHLPHHIRRFGPAILFATESFESFNKVIRNFSVNSNRQAPSRDIGRGFAATNRVRHLISGGFFIKNWDPRLLEKAIPERGDVGSDSLQDNQLSNFLARLPPKSFTGVKREYIRQIGPVAKEWADADKKVQKEFGLPPPFTQDAHRLGMNVSANHE